MISKSVTELHFVDARGPMSTVEIDVDSLPEDQFGYSDLVESALVPLALVNPGLRITVYVYEGPSVNFGDYGHSAFIGVAGSSLALSALHSAFSRVPGLKVRYSDQISQSQALRQYHLEEGRFWIPEEEHVWCTEGEEEDDVDTEAQPDDSLAADQTPRQESAAQGGEAEGEQDENAVGLRTQMPTRFRAARSNASVGTIARSIEEVYGLPEGAVALRGPDKKALRSDATIRTLRKRWE